MISFLPLLNEQINHLQTIQLFHRKNYEEQLDTLLQSNLIIVIEGQRRVGKSSIITSYFTQKNINLDKVFYLNKELDNADLIKDNQDLENAFHEFVKEK
jgi:predicted AAA+ superfamily ATPase